VRTLYFDNPLLLGRWFVRDEGDLKSGICFLKWSLDVTLDSFRGEYFSAFGWREVKEDWTRHLFHPDAEVIPVKMSEGFPVFPLQMILDLERRCPRLPDDPRKPGDRKKRQVVSKGSR